MVLGTPLYMSPEQARGDEDLDHRVDIYALGVIMYEAIAGRVPFVGSNYLSVISQVLNEEPKPLRELRPDLSEEFEAIVAKAMAKDRTQRYVDADAMLKDLTLLLEDPTHSTERARITGPRRRFPKPKIPRTAWAVGGIGVAIAAVTIAVVFLQGNGGRKPQKTVHAQQLAPAPVADAGVALAMIDAEPAVRTIKLHVVTDPPHATVYRESELIGASPVDLELVSRDKEIAVTAQLDGYANASVTVNPLEHTDGQTLALSLKPLPKGAKRPPPVVPMHTGSAVPPVGNAGGELTGYPGAGGGTLPNK